MLLPLSWWVMEETLRFPGGVPQCQETPRATSPSSWSHSQPQIELWVYINPDLDPQGNDAQFLARGQGEAGQVICGNIFDRGLILDLFVCLFLLWFGGEEEAIAAPLVILKVRLECQHVLWAFSQSGLMSWCLLSEQKEVGFSFFFFPPSSFSSFAVLVIFFNMCSCSHTFNEHLLCASQAPAWLWENLKRFKIQQRILLHQQPLYSFGFKFLVTIFSFIGFHSNYKND